MSDEGQTEEVQSYSIINWKPFFNALETQGLLPDRSRTSRIVIEAEVGHVCTITYYCLADGRLLGALGAIQVADDSSDGLVS